MFERARASLAGWISRRRQRATATATVMCGKARGERSEVGGIFGRARAAALGTPRARCDAAVTSRGAPGPRCAYHSRVSLPPTPFIGRRTESVQYRCHLRSRSHCSPQTAQRRVRRRRDRHAPEAHAAHAAHTARELPRHPAACIGNRAGRPACRPPCRQLSRPSVPWIGSPPPPRLASRPRTHDALARAAPRPQASSDGVPGIGCRARSAGLAPHAPLLDHLGCSSLGGA